MTDMRALKDYIFENAKGSKEDDLMEVLEKAFNWYESNCKNRGSSFDEHAPCEHREFLHIINVPAREAMEKYGYKKKQTYSPSNNEVIVSIADSNGYPQHLSLSWRNKAGKCVVLAFDYLLPTFCKGMQIRCSEYDKNVEKWLNYIGENSIMYTTVSNDIKPKLMELYKKVTSKFDKEMFS